MENIQAVRIAAALGDEQARIQVGSTPPDLPDHYTSRIEFAVAPLARHEQVAFACDCASRSMHFWIAFRPDDQRPQTAIDAARDWLAWQDRVDLEQIAGAASDASVLASEEYDRSEGYETTIDEASPVGRAAYRAQWAAIAAAHCAYTAIETEHCYCCAYAAKAAVWATLDETPERAWQASRLSDYLMGRVKTAEST